MLLDEVLAHESRVLTQEQREFYFENRNKDSERRRRLRDIIDRATPLGGA